MNREKTERLLSLYRKFEKHRETLHYYIPTVWDNKCWIGATDGTQFILIPENEDNKQPQPECKTVNIASIMPVLDIHIPLNKENLINTYNSIEVVDVEITNECEACDGYGEFDHYGETYDCKSCDETGIIKTGRFFKAKDPKILIQIGISPFKINIIENILKVIAVANIKQLTIKSEKVAGLSALQADDIIIGAMPANMDHENFKDCKILMI